MIPKIFILHAIWIYDGIHCLSFHDNWGGLTLVCSLPDQTLAANPFSNQPSSTCHDTHFAVQLLTDVRPSFRKYNISLVVISPSTVTFVSTLRLQLMKFSIGIMIADNEYRKRGYLCVFWKGRFLIHSMNVSVLITKHG